MEIVIHAETPLGYSLDGLQSYVEARLGDDGKVTGGGTGIDGWYLYVELQRNPTDADLNRLAEFLFRMKVPTGTTICLKGQGGERIVTIGAEHAGGG